MNLRLVLAGNELLRNLTEVHIDFLDSVSQSVVVAGGASLFEEGGPADTFYIVTEGKIGLELASPGMTPRVIQTLGPGDMVGLSWLFPPYRWNWRARAWEETTLIAFDGVAVRRRHEEDDELRRRLLEVVSMDVVTRLQRTRLQLLDLYGKG